MQFQWQTIWIKEKCHLLLSVAVQSNRFASYHLRKARSLKIGSRVTIICIMGNSLGKLSSSSSLSGRKTLGLNGRKCGNIIRNSVSNRYGRRYASQGFAEIISIQQSLSMILCITRLSNTVAEHIAFELGLLEAIDPTLQTVVSFVDGMRIVICGGGKHINVAELIVGLVQRIQAVKQRLHLSAPFIVVDGCGEDKNLGFLDLCHDFGYIILQYCRLRKQSSYP